ncbi:EF-hand domain-containing protein [Methyloceanibacter caenitepidi]|uniref:EF-hand domain-containing protein n=1 Tax=Methyloceanibacter caenitepidi TaxID=1384459 RepID=A0A0A8K0Z1_9HYPH|nr:EF-hand domain-containing protein [Methyloceanibacter caenitepidi]BAQ16643.1 hypothetical protein GL4_1185 [Methyloceanibacter caenitepidi]
MTRIVFSVVMFLCATGAAVADRGARLPDKVKCGEVWSMTKHRGAVASGGQADVYIVDYHILDVNGDGKVTKSEFMKGCRSGQVGAGSR